MTSHPDFTSETLTPELKREQFLHRLIATSAFIFALCILPVAQYALVGQSAQQREEGVVAGVSTESTKTLQNQPVTTEDGVVIDDAAAQATPTPSTLLACVNAKEKDTADLKKFADGKKRAMLTEYQATVEPYRAAIAVLNGTPEERKTEESALNALITQEYDNYLKELASVEKAVSASQLEIDQRVCPAQ